MKLKKLIPLAGITGVAAVAAPLVASCSTQATEFVWTIGDENNVPKITPVERSYEITGDATEDLPVIKQATQDYFDDIADNNVLFTNDMINHWFTRFDSSATGTASMKTTKINAKNNTISYESTIRLDSVDNAKNYMEYKVKLNNIKFFVIPKDWQSSSSVNAMVEPIVFELATSSASDLPTEILTQEFKDILVDDTWYVDLSAYDSESGTTIKIHIDKNNISSFRSLPDEVRDLLGLAQEFFIRMKSTYLDAVTWGEE